MFIPATPEELKTLGWDRLDVILVTGDSYLDSPYVGISVIGQTLLSAGYRVGIISQPDCASGDAITGLGEPTRRLGVLIELIRRLRAGGARRVRLDTDGLASLREGRDVVPELVAAGLDAVSISLNAPDAVTYARICPSRHGEAAFHACRGFIRSAVSAGLEVSASFVALPELSQADCRAACAALGARFRWRPCDRLGRVGAS